MMRYEFWGFRLRKAAQMTTPARAEAYLKDHLEKVSGRGWAVVNPNGVPIADLPVIFGFNNGGPYGWMSGLLVAQDGTHLGGHVCSNESYMPSDLGVLEGSRPDRHEEFLKHYPGGYRMEFVSFDAVRSHPVLWPIIEAGNAKVEAQQ